jgi:SAM-dependent methyltransferase
MMRAVPAGADARCGLDVESAILRSVRDPAGAVLTLGDRVVRVLRASAGAQLRCFLASRCATTLLEERQLVRTRFLHGSELSGLLRHADVRTHLERFDEPLEAVEHERVAFPSFPYEWPAEMLHAAAELTLTIATRALNDGFGVKDATPYNVLFRGPTPVFVDLLSFEPRDPSDAIWLPYAQFVRTFLLPLIANQRLGRPLDQHAMARRDGMDPEELYRSLTRLQRLRPPFLTLASIPAWLTPINPPEKISRGGHALRDPARARFVLGALLARLTRALMRTAPRPPRASGWIHYRSDHHSGDYFSAKERFVAAALSACRARRVLDIGANAGQFSAIAARAGAEVVAIDRDPAAVGHIWRLARSSALDILPLQVDITRPSPAIGWRNRECPAFLERASGRFDAVLMLALLHHLVVGEGIPLEEVVDLAAQLTTDTLIIEFIPAADPLVRRLARGRDALHARLTRDTFEATCRRSFRIVRSEACNGSGRWLYQLSKR